MILDDRVLAEKIYRDLKGEIEAIKKSGVNPSLGVILVGEDAASIAYIKAKEKVAHMLGIEFKCFQLPRFTSKPKVIELIEDLNKNKFIHGIVVQLPLPEELSVNEVVAKISRKKDVDGFSGEYVPPTAKAIWELLKFYKVDLTNKKIVIVGHGLLVGQPLEKLFDKNGIRPEVITSETPNMREKIASADVVISATGVPNLIKSDMVNQNSVLIDAGTAESGGKLSGDIEPSAYEIVASFSPVPGGVGPVTVAMLMSNLVEAAKR